VFLGNRLVAFVCIVLALSVNTAVAQSLGSPAAVLDALKQSRGDVVLAFIDSPADQSSPLRNIQGLLSVYDVTLNGEDLGSVRRNSVLHVRPRLGLNRLVIRDAFDSSQSARVSFPAMRSAGVSTSIVEIRTSRQFNWIEALQLNGREVQAIEDALKRDESGGMARVLGLIRSRGQESVRPAKKLMNWSRGAESILFASDPEYDSDSQSSISRTISTQTKASESNSTVEVDSNVASSSVFSASSSTSTQTKANESNSTAEVDSSTASGSASSAGIAADSESETGDTKSSVNISSDRRSYY
jgi:hypothetical protein